MYDRVRSLSGRTTSQQWNTDDLQEELRILLARTSRDYKVFFVIDALDESEEPQKTVAYFRRVIEMQGSRTIKIWISSRFDILDTVQSSRSDLQIRVHDGNRDDLSRFVKANLMNEDLTEIFKSQITDRIVANAAGVFLWAKLAITALKENLREGNDSLSLLAKLLPTNLEEAYGEILHRMEASGAERMAFAQRTFQWVAFSMRPLTTSELEGALGTAVAHTSYSTTEGTLPSYPKSYSAISGGLLETYSAPKGRCVQFVHVTVRDFLLQTRYKSSCYLLCDDPSSIEAEAHYRIAGVCMKYLLAPTGVGIIDRRRESKSPFHQYATLNWVKHLQAAEKEFISPPARLLHLKELNNQVSAPWTGLTAIHSQGTDDSRNFTTTFAHFASQHNLYQLLSTALKFNLLFSQVCDHGDATGRTPLSWAAAGGHESIVDMLINRGADISSRDQVHGLTSLCWAAYEGHEGVVRRLIAAGADVNDVQKSVMLLPTVTKQLLKSFSKITQILTELTIIEVSPLYHLQL
jgi:Ankyrin repeats (3 copies)